MRHRLARRDAVALAVRRADDDGRPLVVRTDLRGRDEAHRARGRAREAVRRRRSRVASPRSPRRSPGSPSPPTGARRRGHAVARPALRSSGESPLRSGRRERLVRPARALRRARAADGQSTTLRAADELPRDPARSPRELDVRSPELEDERLSRLQRGQRRREPVRMDEIGIARSSPRSARVRREEQRHEEHLPRTALQVPDDAVPVGEPEVPERGGRDDTRPRLPPTADARPRRERTLRRRRPARADTTS